MLLRQRRRCFLEKVISGELCFASRITTNIIISDLTLRVLGNFLWIHHQTYDDVRENESWPLKFQLTSLLDVSEEVRLIIYCFLLEVERLFNPYLVTDEQNCWEKWIQKPLSKWQEFVMWSIFRRITSALMLKGSNLPSLQLHYIQQRFDLLHKRQVSPALVFAIVVHQKEI